MKYLIKIIHILSYQLLKILFIKVLLLHLQKILYFLKLIYFIILKLVEKRVKFPYIIFTFDFFQKIKNYCGSVPPSGLNDGVDTYPYYLFTEKCSKDRNKCKDGLDRYGLCCYVYDGNERMIKSRYSDFPW